MMKLAFLLLSASAAVVQAHQVVELHGSGTTNPSKCYWSIMETLYEQSSEPLHLTYRAIGSSRGIEEFHASFNQSNAIINVFGSGDLPINNETWHKIFPVKISHLPVLAGTVSFFHSVPDMPNLKLTSCLLTKIFNLDITSWGDREIVDLNPDMSVRAKNTPIRVAHRDSGSSSTNGATTYMTTACKDVKLKREASASASGWPKSDKTMECNGSSGMAKCVAENPGTIGYIDTGHGLADGLPEVLLEIDGAFSNSQFPNSISNAIRRDVLPDNAHDNFANVQFFNEPAAWPIVQMTYIYVAENITFIEDPLEQAILVAFLQALYDPNYVGQCEEKYGFTTMAGIPEIQQFALDAIARMETTVKFIFEDNDKWTAGNLDFAGPNVISPNRRQIADLERSDLMKESVEQALSLENLQAQVDDSEHLSSQNQTQLTAALTLASISFSFWIIWGIVQIYMLLLCGRGGRNLTTMKTTTTSNPSGEIELKNGTIIHEESYS